MLSKKLEIKLSSRRIEPVTIMVRDGVLTNYAMRPHNIIVTYSVFQAETFAINRLALNLLDKDTQNKNIIIYSDSQAAIKALDKTIIKHITVKTCHENLTQLANKGNKVVLSWIPGHRGHEGNELADTLAKMGTKSPKLFHHIKTPAQTIKLLILRHFKKETISRILPQIKAQRRMSKAHENISSTSQKNHQRN